MEVEMPVHCDGSRDTRADEIIGGAAAATQRERSLRRINAAVEIGVAGQADRSAIRQAIQNESISMTTHVVHRGLSAEAELAASFENLQRGIILSDSDNELAA